MDFWKSLIGGSPSTAKTNKANVPDTPEVRLQKFKRVWQSLLNAWRNGRENDPQTQEVLRSHIKRLTDLLIEEEKRSIRLCMNFAYDQQIFIAISKIAQFGSPAVIKEAITAFSTLIDNEDEDFLAQQTFAQSLINFLRKTAAKADPSYESEFVEFLFSIAAKIRLTPSILPVWFTAQDEPDAPNLDPQQKFAGVTNTEDFPLFYLLLDYVHHDGRVGDFARTGLLYIIESASASADLERWIVDSDLATLMASGLGALYSQLSRKLVISYPAEDAPSVLLLSDTPKETPSFGAVPSNSPEFQTHLDTFLSYLVFWQDVLEHCRSLEVKQTLLDHFQVLFLQQLLYPSLLESSDLDGGSSVAVLTYLRVILDTLEHADIIQLILSYLLCLTTEPKQILPPTSASALKRRKSLDMLTMVSEVDDKPTPELYNLVDLILTSLNSRSQLTVSATLRLVSILLRKHHPYTVSTLLKTTQAWDNASQRTIGALNGELDHIFSLVRRISQDDDDLSDSYASYIDDNSIQLESHPCSIHFLASKLNTASSEMDDMTSEMVPHKVRLDDPLVQCLVNLLKRFFSNTVETNLMLTSVVIDMATCCWVNIEGWLLVDSSTYEYEEDSDDEMDEITSEDEEDEDLMEERRLLRMKKARRIPSLKNTSTIMKALETLVDEIEMYKAEIPTIDAKLAERKQAFRFTENLNEALLSSTISATTPGAPRTPRSDSRSRTPGRSSTPTPSNFASSDLRGRTLSPMPTRENLLKNTLMPETPVRRGKSPNTRSALATPYGSHIADTQRMVKPLPIPGSNDGEDRVGEKEFTLSHLLTNITILQEFLKELAALVQVRSSLYGDVSFVA